MTKQEYLRKCKSAIKTLDKIVNGANVSLAKRILACQYAIEVLCYDDSAKPFDPQPDHTDRA